METLKNSKDNIAGDFRLDLKEDDKNIYFSYMNAKDSFVLIYSKEKDICMVLKNGRAAEIKKLNDVETARYKEVLDIAICYHHDRDGVMLN